MPVIRSRDMPVRLERSTLFVPASRWTMIEKAARSAADGVCIDLEDGVAPDEKVAGRALVVRALTELDFGRRLRMYRINGVDTPFAYRDVIDIVEPAGDRIDLVMIPKVGSPDDVRFVDMLLTQIEMQRGQERAIGIAAQIETAAGVLNIREIAQASPRLETLIFGPGDFAASMRMPLANVGEFDAHDELYPGHRWHAAMQAVVAAARVNGLRCLDGPFAGFKDLTGLEHACRIARAMGFDGKECIHPAQIETVHAVFSPTTEEVAWAERVLAAYTQAQAAGRGVISVEGKMIDAVNLRMARVIVEQQRAIEAQHEGWTL